MRSTLIEQVRDHLYRDLMDGVFPPGTKLPNEQELAERYDVSRITIRDAVGGLVTSGLVTRRQGSGTYVNAALPRRHSLDSTVSYTSMIAASGMKAGEIVLSRVTRPAQADEIAALRVDQGTELVCLERIRTADETPVIYSEDRIPAPLVADVPPRRLDASLYTALADAGSPVVSASATLVPVLADARLARLLGVRRGSPLLAIDEIDFDGDGRPVMLSAEWHVPGVFEMHLNRRVR